jgi:hypothetical protein
MVAKIYSARLRGAVGENFCTVARNASASGARNR